MKLVFSVLCSGLIAHIFNHEEAEGRMRQKGFYSGRGVSLSEKKVEEGQTSEQEGECSVDILAFEESKLAPTVCNNKNCLM